MKENGWGIIRYAPTSGAFPEDDECHFDGWYADRDDAKAIYDDWCRRFPQSKWIIAIVRHDEVRWWSAS